VTALLANHAMQHGVRTVLLSAQDDDVARVYERVGFRRVGSTGAAPQLAGSGSPRARPLVPARPGRARLLVGGMILAAR
jgi:hypothetical protein